MKITGFLQNGKGIKNAIGYTTNNTFQSIKQMGEKLGYTIDLIGEAEIIPEKKANKIIETRKPLGKFIVVYDDGKCTAIDNESGDAWCEDRNSIPESIEYLYDLEGEL